MGEVDESTPAKKLKNVTKSDELENIFNFNQIDNNQFNQIPSSKEDMIQLSTFRYPLYGQIRKIIQDKRKWWYTDFGKHYLLRPSHGLDFTIMSYNVLSQMLLENHSYLYTRCQPEHLTWNYRSRNLLREMDQYNADIMCLQEVQETHYHDTFLPYLNEKGYTGVYKKKTGNASDGCAIFFKKQTFSIECKHEVEFYKYASVEVLDRNNVGIIVVLRPENPSFNHLKLVCGNTHLLFNPRRGDVKLAQLRLFLATIETLARKSVNNTDLKEYHPILFCGDMNSEPFYPLYNFVVRGFIKYADELSGNISGQYEGANKGRFMSKETLSLEPLGISQNTCYETLRIKENSKPLENINNLNVDSNKIIPKDDGNSSITSSKCEYFFHPLHFSSAYKHFTENGEKEVTIRLARSLCTVDYIFYSLNKKGSSYKPDSGEEEGALRHIGSYGLLPESDVQTNFDLPNAYLSSDHFCLLSRFSLTSK